MKTIYLLAILISCNSYHRTTKFTRDIRVNQVGYKIKSSKVAVVAGVENKSFKVIDRKKGDVIFTSKTSKFHKGAWSQEKISYANFSAITKDGEYNLVIDGVGISPTFRIEEDPYKELQRAVLKGFYFQRASEDLDERYAGKWKRKGLKTTQCKVWNSEVTKECSGGWFDAGDYGRYSVTTAVAVALLLNSYKSYPKKFDDELGIPESGNGVADVLDEAKVGLNFLLKMQDRDGGVFHKATSKRFNYMFVPPHRAIKQIYLMPKSVTATFDFAAVMAMASTIYGSNEYLVAAKRAWKWGYKNRKTKGFINPAGVKTGEYGDDQNQDELIWAAIELLKATGDKKYKVVATQYIQDYQEGFGWQGVGSLAELSMKSLDRENLGFKPRSTKGLIEDSKKNIYGLFSRKSDFGWGSNGNIIKNGIKLLIEENPKLELIQPVLDYILGRNSLGQCFVTGFGTFAVKNPHHRQCVSHVEDGCYPGLLVGGVNKNLDGIYAQDHLKNKPILKRYIDHLGSYSTNETSIDMNAALLFFVSSY